MDHSCSFNISGWMEEKVVKFVAIFRGGRRFKRKKFCWCFWFRNDWQLKTVRLCLFFQTWWISCWTLLKELCLKKKTGLRTRPLLPKSLNISILARHLMPACCWHIDWRTLACLPVIPCNQPTTVPPYTSVLTSLPTHFDLSLEGSFQPQVGDGSV